MKKQILSLLLCCFPILFYAQSLQVNDFEDGTLNNWTNSDGSTVNLTNEIHVDSNPIFDGGNNYLRKTCDGTNTATGIMSIKSLDFLEGDFFIPGLFGFPAFENCEFIVRNTNSFDLHLRIVLTGFNNAKIVTTNPFIVPANSGWIGGNFFLSAESNTFTLFPGSATNIDVYGVLTSVTSTEVIHSTTISTEGENIIGLLEIDAFNYYFLLSTEEIFLRDIHVFPNPIVDRLFINFPHKTKGTLTLTSIDGKRLLSQELTSAQMQLDMSKIRSKGIYFLKIETPLGTLTKKIVKS